VPYPFNSANKPLTSFSTTGVPLPPPSSAAAWRLELGAAFNAAFKVFESQDYDKGVTVTYVTYGHGRAFIRRRAPAVQKPFHGIFWKAMPTFLCIDGMVFLSLASRSPCPTSSVVAPPAGLRCHGTQKVTILQQLPAENNSQPKERQDLIARA
jgi:hypothetical protein